MPVAFDANFLSILLLPGSARVQNDPTTNRPYDRLHDRVQFLVETLQHDKAKIVLPCPAIAEFMMLAHPDHGRYVSIFRSMPRFEIAEFDQMAAIELVELNFQMPKIPKKDRDGTYAKFKFDRQIVAIARARGCSGVYSTDNGVRNMATLSGMQAFDICDLQPPPPRQESLPHMDNVAIISQDSTQVAS